MSAVNQYTSQSLEQHKPSQVADPRVPFKSETIGKLAEALARAQSEITNALKDKDNPFFKSTYADLASVWDACRDPLTKSGLSVVQPLSMDSNGRMILTTLLMHSSGEWISSVVPVVPVKQDPQSVGSAITYMRRFSLSALVGVAPSEKPTEDDVDDDDDGNAASGRNSPPRVTTPNINPPAPTPIKPKIEAKKPEVHENKPSAAQLSKLFAVAKSKGILSKEELKYWISNTFGFQEPFSLTDLNPQEFQDIILEMEQIEVHTPQEVTQFQADLPAFDDVPESTVKIPHPNAVPEPELPMADSKKEWFKNRKV
jgi:hypothetical protein